MVAWQSPRNSESRQTRLPCSVRKVTITHGLGRPGDAAEAYVSHSINPRSCRSPPPDQQRHLRQALCQDIGQITRRIFAHIHRRTLVQAQFSSTNLHVRPGSNWRMSELHAILGYYQVQRLNDFINARAKVAEIYEQQLNSDKFQMVCGMATPNNSTFSATSFLHRTILRPQCCNRLNLGCSRLAESDASGESLPLCPRSVRWPVVILNCAGPS